jgi:hypothetical protein
VTCGVQGYSHAPVGGDAFIPGTPEVELEKLSGQPVMREGERGKLGWIVLTNDRVLFTDQKFVSTGSEGVLGDLAVQLLQKRSEKKAGGPRAVVELAELRSAQDVKRRLLADLYEFTMADGSTCRVSKTVRDKWSATIRRLLTERHGRSLVDEGEYGFRVA